MTLFPRRREEGRALRWGARDVGLRAPKRRRRLPFSTAEEGIILVHIGMGIAPRWDAGELPSTTPQAEHSTIGQRTNRRRSLVPKVATGRAMPIAGPLRTAAIVKGFRMPASHCAKGCTEAGVRKASKEETAGGVCAGGSVGLWGFKARFCANWPLSDGTAGLNG